MGAGGSVSRKLINHGTAQGVNAWPTVGTRYVLLCGKMDGWMDGQLKDGMGEPWGMGE